MATIIFIIISALEIATIVLICVSITYERRCHRNRVDNMRKMLHRLQDENNYYYKWFDNNAFLFGISDKDLADIARDIEAIAEKYR